MEEKNKLYKFQHEDAEFCYDPANLRLMKGTTRINLEHKPREVLAHLLKNPQKLIRYKELKTAVWGNTHVEDASVHNAVSKVNVALKEWAKSQADFIRTVPGVGVEILVVDPAEIKHPPPPPPPPPPAMEDKVDGATEAAGQEPAVRAEPPSLMVVGDILRFKVDWPERPYNMTLHVDQPLFEKYPGDWFYRGRITSSCPPFYALLLSCPGITSVSRSSPYELSMGRAALAQYDIVVAHISEALKTATGIQDISGADASAPAASASGPPGVTAPKTVKPTAYTDGDWITAAIVARERAETEMKRVASRVSKQLRTDEPATEHAGMIEEVLQTRIKELLEKHAQGGTTDDTRLEACVAKVVADILESELAEFQWAIDERSADDPVLVFRDTIKSLRTRYR